MEKDYICTVLLISYNQEKYIRKALDSILIQKTRYSYKVHVFDDCSTDSTGKIIREYAEKYSDIVFSYISEQNKGAQNNFWNAFLSVDTKYFIVLEGDDYWCNENKLEMQINALEKHPECSFCGHDTYLICLDENSREYAEGSHCCTQPFLKKKSVFSYKDFRYVSNGGYIPYASARMIRTEMLDLKSIQYKEAVLFDFTQFYYLLLKGDYYYYDLPMSVYQRTGSGVCSGKTPMEFLNVFLQNAIDFNKQTNNVIADKIYSDCLIQIDFRLNLYKENYIKFLPRFFSNTKSHDEFKLNPFPRNSIVVMENSLPPDKYFFLCNGGLGYVMQLCACKSAIEERYNTPIYLLMQEKHEFIAKMFSIEEYSIVDMDGVDIEELSDRNPIPMPGQIYVAHPFAHSELKKFCLPILQASSSVRFGQWFAEFWGLKYLTQPTHIAFPRMSSELKNKCQCIAPIEKIVLFLPEAYTVPQISENFWARIAKELQSEGLSVVSCVEEIDQVITGTKYLNLTAEEIAALGMCCHSVYSLRNGICDLLQERGSALHIYYPSHAMQFIYSVNSLFNRNDIIEEIVLEPARNRAQKNGPTRPMLFGLVRCPEFVYQHYVRNKEKYRSIRKFIKKIIAWK